MVNRSIPGTLRGVLVQSIQVTLAHNTEAFQNVSKQLFLYRQIQELVMKCDESIFQQGLVQGCKQSALERFQTPCHTAKTP